MKKRYPVLFMGFEIQRVADACGVPYVTVWRHANGERVVSPKMARRYFEVLGIPLSSLRPDLWPPQEQPEQAARHE